MTGTSITDGQTQDHGTIAHLDPATVLIGDNVRDLSVREHGVLQPITAPRDTTTGQVIVLDGQLRTLAAREAGLATIPVYLRDGSPADTKVAVAARVAHQIVTNDQRSALTDAQRARGIQQMLDAGVTATTVKHEINALAAFCRDTAVWGWTDVPGKPLFTLRDTPRRREAIPRFLPAHELDALAAAIHQLEDPHQKAALLLVRWSGARRDEIRRLTIDCLDRYTDGHPRLRIPVGKSHSERVIPLHPEAAEALRDVINPARSQNCHRPSR